MHMQQKPQPLCKWRIVFRYLYGLLTSWLHFSGIIGWWSCLTRNAHNLPASLSFPSTLRVKALKRGKEKDPLPQWLFYRTSILLNFFGEISNGNFFQQGDVFYVSLALCKTFTYCQPWEKGIGTTLSQWYYIVADCILMTQALGDAMTPIGPQ